MTACFYCGLSLGKKRASTISFENGRGHPPSDDEIVRWAKVCNPAKHKPSTPAASRESPKAHDTHDCYRLLLDVNNYVVSNVRQARSAGSASGADALPRQRAVHSKAAELAAEAMALQDVQLSKLDITLVDSAALEESQLGPLGDASSSTEAEEQTTDAPPGEPSTASRPGEPSTMLKPPQGQHRGSVSKFRPTHTLAPTQLLKRAQTTSKALARATGKAKEKDEQYQKAAEERRALRASVKQQQQGTAKATRKLASAQQALTSALKRLEDFDEVRHSRVVARGGTQHTRWPHSAPAQPRVTIGRSVAIESQCTGRRDLQRGRPQQPSRIDGRGDREWSGNLLSVYTLTYFEHRYCTAVQIQIQIQIPCLTVAAPALHECHEEPRLREHRVLVVLNQPFPRSQPGQ